MHTHSTDAEPRPRLRPIVRYSDEWTLREHEVVVSHWPDKATIRRILPHRTEAAINSFATKCNLRKPVHRWTGAQDASLRKQVYQHVPRKVIAKELGLTPLQVVGRMRYIGLTYPRRRPRITGHTLMDQIRQRQFDLNLSSAELDEACNTGKRFQRWSIGQKIHIKHIIRALKVLDGELTVRWNSIDEDVDYGKPSNVVAIRPD